MRNRFSWQVTLLPLAFIILTAGIFSFLDIFELQREKEKQIAKVTTEFIDQQKALAKNRVLKALELIRFQANQTEDIVRKRVKERVDEAIHIANTFYEKYQAKFSRKELEEQIKLIISNAVFDHPDGYFFAVNMNTEKIIIHKLDKLIGYSMSQHKDLRGTLVLTEQKKLLSDSYGAFQTIYFSKPTNPGQEFPKQLYIRYFKPFNWLIGTGEYLDDMEKRLQEQILERFKSLYTRGNEYLFIKKMYNLGEDKDKPYGSLILSGNPIHQVSQPLFVTDQDSRGNYFRKEILQLLRDHGEGFTSYWHPSPQHGHEVKKTSYFFYDKTWNWTIGSGFYYDTLETQLAKIEENVNKKIAKEIWSSIGITLLISIIMSAIFLVVSRSIARTIDNYAEKLEQTQKIAQLGSWQLDIVNNKLLWTCETYKIFGLPIGTDLTYEIFLNCIHPEDKTYVDSKWEEALSGEPYDIEHRILVDGKVKWVREKAELEFDQEDKCIRAIGFMQDISSLKSSEQELRVSENRLKDIINNMGDWVWEINNDGQYTYVSESVHKIFGYSPEELLGKTPFDLMPKEKREEFRSIFFKLRTKSKPIVDLENWNLDKNGNFICLLTNGVPIVNDHGENIGYRGVDKDITGIKTAEKEKKQLEDRLQQAQKMEAIGTLSGGIAHDFNNILFPIIGLSDLLLEDLPPDSLEYDNAQEINRAGNRAKELVAQILAFSRQSEHEMMPVRFQTVLKEVLKLCRSTIPTNVEIKQNIQQDCGSILANTTQLHQIGMNLITNAYHAIQGQNGEIIIELKEIVIEGEDMNSVSLGDGRYVLLSVTDDGSGMSDEIKSKIFDPYFTTKEKGKGTGLGLSVVYGIVKEYGGDIKVYSEVGFGTTFNVYLPLMEKNFDKKSSDLKVEIQTGREHILLVDDEPSIARLVQLMLERLGYTVTVRMSSVDALEAFKEKTKKFDLVISDMSMPQMTGDQLANEIRQVRPDVPIIICSGFSERINEDRAKAIGVNGFLMKPVVKSDMAQMVRKVLEESKNV